ncbi:TetR/AcrR family transcriptional regulator [Shimazuella kribbensis]|uniref:TetR/AcrR family transcriptional regulator n=1 Tax=Shimazuella kribbensis TaxID=139808 RepID=UPI0004264F6A|nr:TetR/AcrR family transcriptional regulator [Shimazuella kribbensis]
MSRKLQNQDKMLLSAIELIAEKGYKGVTTQEIAKHAGFSEKTLFRNFGTKLNLLLTAYDRFHYGAEMTALFHEKLVHDLPTDLKLISKTYHDLMNQNRKLIMISIKDEHLMDVLKDKAQNHPRQLLRILTEYLTQMQMEQKIREDINPESLALAFMMMNFGAFMNNLDVEKSIYNMSLDTFVKDSVQIFVQGLKT